MSRASGDLSFKVARSGPTSTPSFPRRWQDGAQLLEEGGAGVGLPFQAQGGAIGVDDSLPGRRLLGEEGLGAGLELAIAVREQALATGGVDVGRRHPAVRERREQVDGPRLAGQQGVEDRAADLRGVAFPAPEEELGDTGVGGPPEGGHGRLLEADGDPGPEQTGDQVAIVGMARGAPAQQGHGREPVDLGGRIVADQGAGGVPERDELGFHILPERPFPRRSREASHPASPENCQGAKRPPGRAGVAIDRASDSIAPRSWRVPAIATSGSTSPGLGSASPSRKSSASSVAT